MRAAILIEAYGRFGGAQMTALVQYNRLKDLGKYVDLFAGFTDTHVWAWPELKAVEIKPLPRDNSDREVSKLKKVV